jgi:uncharacterized protein (DUF4415 family)
MNSKPGRQRSRPSTAAREARRDRSIDVSDIPPLDDGFFERAARNPFYRPVKKSTTIRLDADVLAWLRSQGSGYQTRLNTILRAAMLRDTAARPRR